MKILVSGLVNIETTVAVRGFPIEYYPIDFSFFGINSNVSGVGYNIAKALKTLGDDINLFSFTGNDDEGKRVLSRLKKDKINCKNIKNILKNTPVSAVLYDESGRRQIYCDLKDIQEQSIDFNTAQPDLKSCDAAVLCNIEFNRGLIKNAGKSGILTATDVHVLSDIEDDYNRDFMENADILFLSDEKLPCPAGEFIKRLHSRYKNKIIVIGMGGKGAMLLDGESGEISVIPAYKGVKIVNTVGAGDALFSAFLHYYLKMKNPRAALERAVVFAGIKIGSDGASNGFSAEEEIEAVFSS